MIEQQERIQGILRSGRQCFVLSSTPAPSDVVSSVTDNRSARPGRGEHRWHSGNAPPRIFQYDRTTKPMVELILQRVHSEDAAFVKQTIERASQDGKDFDFEHRLLKAGGSVKYVHIVARAVRDESGGIEFVGSVMDVTERIQAEDALRQAQADLAHASRVTAMGELTASLAHEVNQPITAAITNANSCLRWLAADTPNIEEARAAVTRIVNDGTRASEIIKRIRLLFKKGTLERALVDVNEVIREMIVLLHVETMRYSISVRTELAADLPQAMGDRVQLQQVMMNLIMNSIFAMKDVDGTRELTIKSQRAENDQLLVSVSDTGVGLPPQQTDQIFSAFLPQSLRALGWDFASAAPSSNLMAAACGLPTTLCVAQVFISLSPPKLRHTNDASAGNRLRENSKLSIVFQELES